MKTLSVFVLLLLTAKGYINAQSPEIELELRVEDQKVAINKGFTIQVISGKDTLPLVTTAKGFYIPDSLANTKKVMLFNINQFKLSMDTPLTWQKGLPLWSVSVDIKPISKENKNMIPKVSRKRTTWVYTLNKMTGSLITYYRFDKPKIP
jgi:hypothetical protein